MQVLITARGLDLTNAIREYAEKKFSALEKFHDKIIRAHVTLERDSHHNKGDVFLVECKIEVPGNDLFVSKNEPDLYKAIDKVQDHLREEIKKKKSKEFEKNIKEKRNIRDTKEYKP